MVALSSYLGLLHDVTAKAEVTDEAGVPLARDTAIAEIIALLHHVWDIEGKNILISNGGSASIASHMAIDCSKIGGYLPCRLMTGLR
jgi:D-sedoheptulose 7-phosphate isomerase